MYDLTMSAQPQQATLFAILRPVRCLYCHADQAKVQLDREILAARYPRSYPNGPDDGAICCIPGDEPRCPGCHSDRLNFGLFAGSPSTWTGDGEGESEMYECHACGSRGPAEECDPPAQPWGELEAVLTGVEEQLEIVRRAPAREMRPAVELPEVA